MNLPDSLIDDNHSHLILGRKTGEGIIIEHPDGDVMVRVSKSNGHSHRLSITAPKQSTILREELDPNHPLRSR